LAERDEHLLEHYMEHGYDPALWLDRMRTLIREHRIFPYACGSALQDVGVREFLESIGLLTMSHYDENEPFAGKVYKVRHDSNGVRLTYIKALSGKLHVRDELAYGGGNREKITQIRKVNGHLIQQADVARVGELFAVTGLTSATVGDSVGALQEKSSYVLIPTLRSKVVVAPGINMKEVYAYFRMLDAEDPSLHVTW